MGKKLSLPELICELEKIDRLELHQNFLSYLKKYVDEYPMEIMLLLCKGVNYEGNFLTENNPFGKLVRLSKRRKKQWTDLARIITNKINICMVNSIDFGKEEYISLSGFTERDFYLNEDLIQSIIKNYYYHANKLGLLRVDRELGIGRELNSKDILRGIFKILEKNLSDSIWHIYASVYRGLPLYKKNNLNGFSIVSESSCDFIYIFMRGFYDGLRPKLMETDSLPDWTRKYYFKSDDIDAFEQFYDSEIYDLDDDRTIQLRRTAFRKIIGQKDVFGGKQETYEPVLNGISGNHNTKLMRIQKEVLDRFYGEQFDMNDSDTWAPQQIVVDWLKSEYQLSDREAKSIDIVTRPDQARGK